MKELVCTKAGIEEKLYQMKMTAFFYLIWEIT